VFSSPSSLMEINVDNGFQPYIRQNPHWQQRSSFASPCFVSFEREFSLISFLNYYAARISKSAIEMFRIYKPEVWDLLDSISSDFDCKAALGGQFQVLETKSKEIVNLTCLSARKAAVEGEIIK